MRGVTLRAMFLMAVGHSGDVDLAVALEEVFASTDRGLDGHRPIGGLLFVSDDTDPRPIVAAVRQRYPGIALAGCTAVGEMSSTLGLEEDSVALAVFAGDGFDVTVGLGLGVRDDPDAAAGAAVDDATRATSRSPRLAIAFSTVRGSDPALALDKLHAALGDDVPVVGGGAAPAIPQHGEPEPSVFAGDAVTTDGIVVLLLSGAVAFAFGVATGWRPVGPTGTVTRASSGWIDEIDGHPALEFYERYLGGGDPPLSSPLAVYEPGSATPYLRAPIATDRAVGRVGVFGHVPEGAGVQITVAATDEIFGGTRAALDRAIEGFPPGATRSAGLVFSCAVRKYILGMRTGREIEMARDALGPSVPIAGFYCAGEIAPIEASGTATRFHNETIVALALGSDDDIGA